MTVEELLERARSAPDRLKDDSLMAAVALAGADIPVARPQTYMNLSGQAVARIARRRGLEPGRIVLIYDEADLPLGRIRIRAGGSAGGHRGVASILEALGTRDVPRVRLGIGKEGEELAEHVLSRFTREELPVVRRMVEEAADAVESIARHGIADAMNRYNRRSDPAGE